MAISTAPQVEGALVALDPHDGAVLALVGGFNFQQSNFNRSNPGPTPAWLKLQAFYLRRRP